MLLLLPWCFDNRLGLGIFFFTIIRAIHVHFFVGAVCFKPLERFPISEHPAHLFVPIYVLEALMKVDDPVVIFPWPP